MYPRNIGHSRPARPTRAVQTGLNHRVYLTDVPHRFLSVWARTMDESTTTTPLQSGEQQTNQRSLRVPYSHDRIRMLLDQPDGSKAELFVTGRNISKGGIGVLVERHVARGTHCEIDIESRSGKISRHAAVVVFDRAVRGELHEIGLMFEEVIDLEQYVTLQRVQRMIYAKEKKADEEKAQRVRAHALAQAAREPGAAPAASAAPQARPIFSKLAGQADKHDELLAYVAQLAERTEKLAAAADLADRQAMLDQTQWVIDTAEPHGFTTLFAVASAVATYLEDEEEDLDLIRAQVKELIGYLSRARFTA